MRLEQTFPALLKLPFMPVLCRKAKTGRQANNTQNCYEQATIP
jgi:hypothetical protein